MSLDPNWWNAAPGELYGDDRLFCDPDEDSNDCEQCGGEGWITAECFEDTCCCADPDEEHGSIPCPNCNPEGR